MPQNIPDNTDFNQHTHTPMGTPVPASLQIISQPTYIQPSAESDPQQTPPRGEEVPPQTPPPPSDPIRPGLPPYDILPPYPPPPAPPWNRDPYTKLSIQDV